MSWVAAAGAAVSVGSALLSKPSSSSSSTKDPTYLSNAKQDLVSRGETLSNREYTPYTGNRVQGLSDNEQQASELAKQTGQQTKDLTDKATSQLDASTEAYSGDALKKYMNPYTDSVLKGNLRTQNEQYDREKTALTNSKAGAWGGDRSAFAASELEKNQMNATADISNKTYKDAFDEANKNFFTDKARQQTAATAYERTAGDITQMNQSEVQALMATGGTERLLKQAGLDQQYSTFLEKRDWDVNNLDTLIKSIQGASGNTTTTKTGDKNGAVGQALGAGVTLAGMYFGNRSSGSSYKPYDGAGGGISADSALEQSLAPY
jgi:hypothetical protein